MRRVMLLALLGLALPTAALAGTISFTYDTGMASQITSGSVRVHGTDFTATVTGGPGALGAQPFPGLTITFSTTNLDCPAHGLGVCTFTSGTVTVDNNGGVLFTGGLMDGRILRSATSTTEASALMLGATGLVPTSGIGGIANGNLNGMAVNYNPHNGAVTNGRLALSGATIVPEPGTLGMLGTGLIGLSGFARRKLKLPR